MDPVTMMTALSIGAMFCLNRLAAAYSAKKQRKAAAPAAGKSNDEDLRERVGNRDRREPGHDAPGQARGVPAEHLRPGLTPPPAPAAAPEPTPAIAPAGIGTVEVRSVRDTRSGKFVKRPSPAAA